MVGPVSTKRSNIQTAALGDSEMSTAKFGGEKK
jgi:hypothetical protein